MAAVRHVFDQAYNLQNASHIGSDGSDLTTRIKAVIPSDKNVLGAGENTLSGVTGAEAEEKAWVDHVEKDNQYAHRANILNRTWTHAGYGALSIVGGVATQDYVQIQDFTLPKDTPACPDYLTTFSGEKIPLSSFSSSS